MIKVKVTEEFTLQKFDEIKNLVRGNAKRNEKGRLYVGDTFECTVEMCKYLTGNNPLKKTVVQVMEVVPENVEVNVEEKPKKAVKKKK